MTKPAMDDVCRHFYVVVLLFLPLESSTCASCAISPSKEHWPFGRDFPALHLHFRLVCTALPRAGDSVKALWMQLFGRRHSEQIDTLQRLAGEILATGRSAKKNF